MKRNENGLHVKELQLALEHLGYTHPRWGVDGWLGSETLDNVAEFAEDHGLDTTMVGDDEVADELVQLVLTFASTSADPTPAPTLPPHTFDSRLQHVDKQGRERRWSDVTGITLHQTATCFLNTEDPDSGKTDHAIGRVSKIKAHAVVLRNGAVSLNAPLTHRMAQAQRWFNKTDVGVEIDGWYGGVHTDLSTFWKPKSRPSRKPMELSAIQVEACRDLCRWIVETVAANGGAVRYIHAHRQTHRGKPSDPGQLLWQSVAMWCQQQFGLTNGGDGWVVPHNKQRRGDCFSDRGPGRPIPREWDSASSFGYRDKVKA